MKERYEIRMAGTTGEGLNLAGLMLAEAAIRDGRQALHSQLSSDAIRGGPKLSDIIISRGRIDYPRILRADVLVATTEEAYYRYAPELGEGALVILDSSFCNSYASTSGYRVPLCAVAEQATGNKSGAGVVALGVLTRLSGIVSREAILSSVRDRAPHGAREANLRALLAGFGAAAEMVEAPEPVAPARRPLAANSVFPPVLSLR